MTPDEMDKKIEFILQMQAQFESNIGKLETNVARSEANIGNLGASIADLAVVVRDSIKLSDDRFSRFDQMMREMAEAQKTTGERLRELADAQKTTDERLNALISVVERHITGPDHAPRP
jgi:DNA repair exonuclease SbcCD ATPase subunit